MEFHYWKEYEFDVNPQDAHYTYIKKMCYAGGQSW